MKIRMLLLLATVVTYPQVTSAVAGPGDDILEENKKRITQTIQRTLPPWSSCVKKQAHELSSSSERAEAVARAALGSCTKEEGNYRHAMMQLGAEIGVPEEDHLQHLRQQLYEMALAIIVRARLPAQSSGNN